MVLFYHPSKTSQNIQDPFHLQVLEGLPIGAGVLSEEGSECTNKIFRFNRLHHARQNNVGLNLLDCFTRSHYQADPRIQRIFNIGKVL